MEGYRVTFPIRPRFRDTDAMGHLNNAVYVTYFEVARAEYWRHMTGTTQYDQVPFILAHTTIDFRSPAYVSEVLEVGIRVARLGNKSFDCEYRIEEQTTGRLICEGRSVQVIFDYKLGKAYPLPEPLAAQVRAFEGRAGL